MKTFSEFRIKGRVKSIRWVRDTLRVSVVSETRQNETIVNEVSIPDSILAERMKQDLNCGDLVLASGTIREIEFEQFGEKIYASSLVVSSLEVVKPGNRPK